jgi:hypothetical protein
MQGDCADGGARDIRKSSRAVTEKKYGVSDGFRISSDPQATQEYQALTSADHGKIEQEIRKSATSRNQKSDKKGA